MSPQRTPLVEPLEHRVAIGPDAEQADQEPDIGPLPREVIESERDGAFDRVIALGRHQHAHQIDVDLGEPEQHRQSRERWHRVAHQRLVQRGACRGDACVLDREILWRRGRAQRRGDLVLRDGEGAASRVPMGVTLVGEIAS